MRLERAINAAGCSLLIAGFGQLLQERSVAAFWHCLAVVSLLLLGVIDDGHRLLWIGLAVTINAWSIIDAFVWESRGRQTTAT